MVGRKRKLNLKHVPPQWKHLSDSEDSSASEYDFRNKHPAVTNRNDPAPPTARNPEKVKQTKNTK